MSQSTQSQPAGLTGRVSATPATLLHEEVLAPQFRYEVEHLLPHYVRAEKALLIGYRGMRVLNADEVRTLSAALAAIGGGDLTADPAANLSDVAFALEVTVARRTLVPRWHVDRSRNDLQACVQLMFGRERMLSASRWLVAAVDAAHRLAARHLDDVMPGFTHLQTAQVVTPGFYVSALSAHLLRTLERLLAVYDRLNLCPLGSGAMSGQELPWDRAELARLLGFAGVQPHALVGVASRDWLLDLAAECSTFGVGLSRFLTDLMAWSGSEYGFISLPDELAGISSAMPQKKNYPVLERIRSRTAHLSAWYADVAAAQRNTPFSNTVEVSKEGSRGLVASMDCVESICRLLAAVLGALTFETRRLRERCGREYLGGFSLANRLTLTEGVPWRAAQVIAGRYILAALATDRGPGDPDPPLLERLASEAGYQLRNAATALDQVFDPDAELLRRTSAGSACPGSVAEMLAEQSKSAAVLAQAWRRHADLVESVDTALDELIGPSQDTPGEETSSCVLSQ
jgi:argininosuccinate lyase